MEDGLTHDQFIAYHRSQINPKPVPEHALTFAYGDWKYGILIALIDPPQ